MSGWGQESRAHNRPGLAHREQEEEQRAHSGGGGGFSPELERSLQQLDVSQRAAATEREGVPALGHYLNLPSVGVRAYGNLLPFHLRGPPAG